MNYKVLTAICALSLLSFNARGEECEKDTLGYQFTVTKELKTNSVKDQSRSGTCWSFSALSFIEDDLLRQGKPSVDLSEMFVVRNNYIEKAIKYVRMHGTLNFAAGGSAYDVLYIIDKYGIVPEEVYSGLNYGTDHHYHAELDAVLKNYLDAVIANPNKKLTTSWLDGFVAVVDAYLGKVPETFTYEGKEYTPQSFAQSLGIQVDDYISLTSYTHHDFYKPFAVEVPDNWLWSDSYNLPLDEMMATIDHAIEHDCSIMWASDVSERGFQYLKGFAVVPVEKKNNNLSGTELSRWVKLSRAQKEDELYKFESPEEEKVIDQQMRQEAFDNYETTDDHGMVIMGTAVDQNGTRYYKVKNSWGTEQIYGGFFYASEAFVRYKTMSIVVRKDAVPAKILKKLNLEK